MIRIAIKPMVNTMKHNSIILAGALALTAPLWFHTPAQAADSGAPVAFVTDQSSGEHLARVLLGSDVQNSAGENVGDIRDLVFDSSGHISTVLLGVGGFLGMGEKNVGIPFSSLTYTADKNGTRVITVALTKEALKAAPAFKATEKTTMDAVKDKAVDLGNKTAATAGQLKDEAAKKFDDMTKTEPANKK